MAKDSNNTNCPLCGNNSEVFSANRKRPYYICNNCKGIFVPQVSHPDSNLEKSRYLEHNNDVNDIRYQNFVQPIINAVTANFSNDKTGLDFGAGTGPVIAKILEDLAYDINLYDPYFHPDKKALEKEYDFIVSCEVIEHFYNPAKEFNLLKKLLKNKGKIFCMTEIYNESINFDKWYYKNDLTHVFIYQKETLYRIKENFGFSNVDISGRLITFEK